MFHTLTSKVTAIVKYVYLDLYMYMSLHVGMHCSISLDAMQ